MKTQYTEEEINRMFPEKRFTIYQKVAALTVVSTLLFAFFIGQESRNKKETTHTIEVHFSNGTVDTMAVTSREQPHLSYGKKTRKPMIVCDNEVLCYNVDFFKELSCE